MVDFPALKHGVENAMEKAAATMSDNDIREAGIAVYKVVWDNSFKGATLYVVEP